MHLRPRRRHDGTVVTTWWEATWPDAHVLSLGPVGGDDALLAVRLSPGTGTLVGIDADGLSSRPLQGSDVVRVVEGNRLPRPVRVALQVLAEEAAPLVLHRSWGQSAAGVTVGPIVERFVVGDVPISLVTGHA